LCVKQQAEKNKTQFWQQTRIQNSQNRKALLQSYRVCEKKVNVVRNVVTEGETERVSATARSCYGERNLTGYGNTLGCVRSVLELGSVEKSRHLNDRAKFAAACRNNQNQAKS